MSSVMIIGSRRPEVLEGSYTRAFRALGWEVEIWEPAQNLSQVVRGGRLGRSFSTLVHVDPWVRKAGVNLLQLADRQQPDLVLVIGTTGVRAGTLAQLRVRLPSAIVYCLYPDSPHLLDTERILCLPFFDRVFTSSPAWITAFERLGARHVTYLPFAADMELYGTPATVERRAELTHDLTFIGSWRPEREAVLEQLADLDLCIWGNDSWRTQIRPNSPLSKRWGGRAAIGQEFSQICAGSKISLNILDVVTWPGPNMRAFELPACGAFALMERTPALLEIFREGETVECFATIGEARDKIAYYVTHEDQRQRIAQASYAFVVQGHTYQDRVRQLITGLHEEEQLSSR